ncbi:MAG: hypothetical protein NXI14_14410 [bacterium]|nr:hypothetical protein [bacterium]
MDQRLRRGHASAVALACDESVLLRITGGFGLVHKRFERLERLGPDALHDEARFGLCLAELGEDVFVRDGIGGCGVHGPSVLRSCGSAKSDFAGTRLCPQNRRADVVHPREIFVVIHKQTRTTGRFGPGSAKMPYVRRDSIEDVWDPLAVELVDRLFRAIGIRWWIAGGHAIDLFVGHQTREHGDVDVVVLRRDQIRLREAIDDWQPHVSVGGRLELWQAEQRIDAPVQDVWCRDTDAGPWRFQVMLVDSVGEDWVFKRDPSIRRSLDEIGAVGANCTPYLRPEVQLLYHARAEVASKHQHDFDAVVGLMDSDARRWLRIALERRFPSGHPWAKRLP